MPSSKITASYSVQLLLAETVRLAVSLLPLLGMLVSKPRLSETFLPLLFLLLIVKSVFQLVLVQMLLESTLPQRLGVVPVLYLAHLSNEAGSTSFIADTLYLK